MLSTALCDLLYSVNTLAFTVPHALADQIQTGLLGREAFVEQQAYVLQEKGLGQKEEAKKQLQQQKDPANNTDTADSSHAAAAGNSAALPASRHGTNPEKAEATRAEGGKQGEGAEGSPFACVSVILGWETFHMVHVLWIGLVDMPGKAPEKDWEMQVWALQPSEVAYGCCCTRLSCSSCLIQLRLQHNPLLVTHVIHGFACWPMVALHGRLQGVDCLLPAIEKIARLTA